MMILGVNEKEYIMTFINRILNLNAYTLIARIAVVLLILPLHEYAHGWMAKRCGDDTAEASGRLTLNPFAHMDPFGTVLLILTGYGWAKPVPINPSRMNRPKSGVVWTSLAGPGANLVAALVGTILLQICWPFYCTYDNAVMTAIYYFLSSFITTNISLAVFNLIPVPPLDGSKVLMALLPYKASMWMQRNSKWLSLILWILVLVGVISVPLNYLSDWILDFFLWITDWICTLVWKIV